MTRVRHTALSVIVGAALVLSARPSASARQPEHGGAPALQSANARQVTELDVNGLKVLIKERPGSQTIAAGLYIRGGSRNVTATDAGIESLMLSVATEASVNYPREKFRRELSRTGTVIGSGVNHDYSAFTLGCTREHFDEAWAIFADAAMHPSFDPADFDRVKSQHLLALQSDRDTPDAALESEVERVLYAGHPYANDPNGTPETIAKLTVDDLKRFHQQVMETSRLLLVIVGDMTADAVRAHVEATLGKLPRGTYKEAPVPSLVFTAPSLNVTPKSLPTNYVRGLYAAPPPSSPDIYPLRVANSILQALVFQEVREKRALSYAPEAFLGSGGANTGGIYVTAVDANTAVQVMLAQINTLRRQEVNSSIIDATAQDFLTTYYLGQETNAAQAGSLAQAELLSGGWKTADEFIEKIRAVKPADVRRVASMYMRSLQFVVLGDPAKIDRRIFLSGGLIQKPDR